MKIAVVLTFESLPLRFLGCYGCLEHQTPCWNRLASESVVFDLHFAENLDPAAKNRAWWTGRSQSLSLSFRTHAEQRREENLLTPTLRLGGVASHLFLQTAENASTESPAGFDPAGFDTVTISPKNDAGERFVDWIDSAVRRLRAIGTDERRSQLFWLKADGLKSIDGEPGSAEDFPELSLIEKLKNQDRALGRLCDAVREISELPSDVATLFVVTAASGMPCGEQPHLPGVFQRLGEAVVHTPLLIRVTNGAAGSRCRSFVQSVDLVPTLFDWFRLPADEVPLDGRSLLPFVQRESGETANSPQREFVVSVDGRLAWGIRTQDHYLMTSTESAAQTSATPPQLFLKPEDVWEINDVAQQDPETVAALELLLASITNAVESQETESTPARRVSEGNFDDPPVNASD